MENEIASQKEDIRKDPISFNCSLGRLVTIHFSDNHLRSSSNLELNDLLMRLSGRIEFCWFDNPKDNGTIDGRIALSDLTFPDGQLSAMNLFIPGGSIALSFLRLHDPLLIGAVEREGQRSQDWS
jgi:hypothetical protein